MKNRLLMSLGLLALVVAVVLLVRLGSSQPQSQEKVVASDATTDFPLPTAAVAAPVASNVRSNSTPAAAAGAAIPHIPAAAQVAAESSLWQIPAQQPDTTFDGVPAKRLQADPGVVAAVHTGQKLHLSMPHSNSTLEALIESTHNLTPHTQVWQGSILHGHPQDNITITRGKIETHVTIATFEGTYSAVIDNSSGSAIMVDEADLHANQIPHDDGIAVEPIEHHPPVL